MKFFLCKTMLLLFLQANELMHATTEFSGCLWYKTSYLVKYYSNIFISCAQV
jgi:hypothetical protein